MVNSYIIFKFEWTVKMLTALLVIIYLAFISLGLPDSLLGTAWPVIYQDLNVPLSSAGVLSFTIMAGTIVSSFFSGRVIRKFGTGRTTFVSVSMTAIAIIGYSLTNSFPMLFLLSIPLGLGAGSVDAALNNFVALHYKASHMNLLHCFWGIGATAGPVIMSFYLNGNGWQSGYFTIGIIQSILAVILLSSLPLWKRFAVTAKNKKESSMPSLSEILKIKGSKAVLISFFCYCTVESTAGLWGSSFLVLIKKIPTDTAASFVSLFYLGITLGRLLSGILTKHVTNKILIRAGQVSLLFAAALIVIANSNWFLAVCFLLIGLSCAPVFPALLHDTPKNFGKEKSQDIMGIQMASAYLGSTTMPLLFGLLGENLSFVLFPVFLLLFGGVMLYMTEQLNKKAKSL